jgi:hypothetical protein
LAADDALAGDWSSYYVNWYGRNSNLITYSACADCCFLPFNRFADRDMFMRYWGGGVGHFGAIPAGAPATNVSTDDEASDDEDEGAEDNLPDGDGISDDKDTANHGDHEDDWDLYADDV